MIGSKIVFFISCLIIAFAYSDGQIEECGEYETLSKACSETTCNGAHTACIRITPVCHCVQGFRRNVETGKCVPCA